MLATTSLVHEESTVDLAATQSDDSRPASPAPSDHESDRDEIDRQESPITSIDEDSRARLQVPRKTSAKVQQLVDKFDGLSQAAVQEPPLSSGRRERSKTRPAYNDESFGSGDAADYGDWEGAHHILQSSPALPRPSTLRLPQFEPDLSLVDELFTRAEALFLDQRPGSSDVSRMNDRVISDSFAGISERKTWYRVSRHGSARMHDAGDDEGYRRMAWASSAVRLDTIKIVRRWLEEESLGGRPMLGGGAGRRHGFGWDSAAEPVSLASVLGRKTENKTQARVASAPSALGPQSTAPMQWSGHEINMSSWAAAFAASFAWSSDPSAGAIAPKTSTRPSAGHDAIPVVDRVPGDNENKVEDDDWGEMVSPSADSKPPGVLPDESPEASKDVPEAAPAPIRQATTKGPESVRSRPTAATQGLASAPTRPLAIASTVTLGERPSGATASASAQPVQAKGDAEDAEDADGKVLRRIVAALPDLTYMLR